MENWPKYCLVFATISNPVKQQIPLWNLPGFTLKHFCKFICKSFIIGNQQFWFLKKKYNKLKPGIKVLQSIQNLKTSCHTGGTCSHISKHYNLGTLPQWRQFLQIGQITLWNYVNVHFGEIIQTEGSRYQTFIRTYVGWTIIWNHWVPTILLVSFL